jgi:hypothetical protein
MLIVCVLRVVVVLRSSPGAAVVAISALGCSVFNKKIAAESCRHNAP